LSTDGNDTETEVFVFVDTEICGAESGSKANDSGADASPTTDVAKLAPSPIDVIVAVNVSPVVKPVKVKVPEVLPVIGVVEFAVVSWNVMVLETALGSGVNVTVMDDGVAWASVGAAGWANCESTSVSGADKDPTDDVTKFVPSPMDVTAAV
jgi:hypothetical protein